MLHESVAVRQNNECRTPHYTEKISDIFGFRGNPALRCVLSGVSWMHGSGTGAGTAGDGDALCGKTLHVVADQA